MKLKQIKLTILYWNIVLMGSNRPLLIENLDDEYESCSPYLQ